MKRVILFTMALLYLFGFSKEIHAQQKIDNAKSKNSTSAINKHAKSYSIFSSLSLQPNVTIGGEEFSDPERNFIPSNNINYAGDINGDGKADFYYTVIAADESTSDLTDQITKIVVIYGSDDGLDEANSDLIRDGFRYVTDITGDGVAEAIKYEDDVLYLVVDESTGELQSLVDIELFELSYSLEYGSFGDFNGDGFRDILVYDGGAITANAVSEFYIINGAGALENVSVDTLQYMNGQNFRYDKMTYGDVDDDGKTELIQVSSLSPDLQSSFGLINIYQMNASQELELISTDTLSMDIFEAYTTMRFGEIGLLDANNDSNMELIISADDQVRILELSDAQGEYYSIDNALPNVFMASDFAIINDFNGNGAKELMLTSSDSALFIESDASLQLTSTKLPVQEGDLIGFPENLTENRSSGGDVNGDGIDDIVVDFSNSES